MQALCVRPVISNSFLGFKSQYNGEKQNGLDAYVPKNTKIIIGETATSNAATGMSASNTIADIKDGNSFGKMQENSQYGGIMVWSINYDAVNNFNFADTVYPAL